MPSGPHAGNRNRPAYSGQQRFRFPKQIIELFAPRKPLEFKPPPGARKLRPMAGLASFVSKFESQPTKSSGEKSDVAKKTTAASFETPAQRRLRIRNEKLAKVVAIVKEQTATWDPSKSTNSLAKSKTTDAFKTLFVYNIPFTTVEQRIQDEFETFGAIRSVVMPTDLKGMPRGYAFVEFERERDLRIAYQEANGIRINGRRILVDVERARTVKGWLPNRLDGPNNSCVKKRRSERRERRPPP